MTDKLELYRQYILLKAEAGGLSFREHDKRIRENALEQDALLRTLGLRPFDPPGCKVSGLYDGGEDLAWVVAAGIVDPWDFARGTLEFLAGELDANTGFSLHTLIGVAHAFGAEAVNMLFDEVTEALAGMTTEHRRWEGVEEVDDGEVPVFASYGDDDSRMDETWSLTRCSADDECATPVTIAAIEIGSLAELIEARDAAARRVLRGDVVLP